MPKVGTELIKARRGNKYHEIDIHFYKKDMDFQPRKMPEGFDLWHGEEISERTYAECLNKSRELIQNFWDSSVTQRKVIAYNMQCYKSSDQYNQSTLHSQYRRVGPGPGLYIEYKVWWEVIMGGKKFYSERRYKSEEGRDGAMLHWGSAGNGHLYSADGMEFTNKKFAPHTDELEAFFQNIKQSMNDMVGKIEDFFIVDPELLVEKIKNQKLLQ